MITHPTFESRLREVVDESLKRRETRQAVTKVHMAEIEKRLKHASFLVKDWMTRIVRPKMDSLAAMFPSALPVASDPSGDCLHFE